jgi:hypothetical protein
MSKNESQQSTGYKKTMEENRMLLRQITEKLKAVDESQARHPGNWGYNGTAGYIKERLQEIYVSIKSIQ